MVNKFYIRYILFIIILLLIVLIVERKNQVFTIFYDKDINFNKQYDYEEEYLIYVADKNDLIFPINIITLYDKNFIIDYYHDKINNDFDKKIYLTFALLTNYSNYLPKTLKTFIPKSTRILNYNLLDNCLELNLSKDFLIFNPQFERKLLKIITYTYTSINEIETIKIKCEGEVYKENLTKKDFILNLYFNKFSSNLKTYQVYYFTEVDDSLYLLKVTFIDKDSTSIKDKLNVFLINNKNIPVNSLLTEDDIKGINLLDKDLAYYQFYLTYYDNNIIDFINIDITDINYYYCKLY